MAINLLRLARFVDGERPSAEKFNKLFSYIENKLNVLNESVGSTINNGVSTIVDSNNATFNINLNHLWGIKKFLLEEVNNAKERYGDIVSLPRSIGSMSNLNPLTLSGEKQIAELIPLGINEFEFEYPLLIAADPKESLIFNSWPEWLDKDSYLEEDDQMISNGQWKLFKSFDVVLSDGEILKYAKSMVWYTTSTSTMTVRYETNPDHWAGGASYQGSSFNVIPDFNTPKTAINSPDINGFFYNLKFTNNGGDYTTVELPYVLYQQTSLKNLETALLSSADINHQKRLTLPKFLKDYQLTLEQETEFPLPKGILTLVDFSESTFTILDSLNYIYVDEHTFKVNISSAILNCVTANPNSDSYKQLFLLVNGTDITRSINDLQVKQFKHSHDGSFGEPLINIKNIAGIYEKTDRNVYFPSARGGHIASQYFHRDGYRYNSDPQNYDNAIMGDILMYGEGSTEARRSYKLFFADYKVITEGINITPGHYGLVNSYSWIGLASSFTTSNTLNLQSSVEGNISIVSDNTSTIVSKNSNFILVKEVLAPESLKLMNGNLSEERIEDLKGTSYIYQDSVKTEIHSVGSNKIVSYLNDEDHSSKIETNYSSDTNNLVKISANKGLVELETKDFEINYKNYDYTSKEDVKNSRPVIKLNVASENQNFQLNETENIKSTLSLNNTNTEEGIFVYTVHHLINEPDLINNSFNLDRSETQAVPGNSLYIDMEYLNDSIINFFNQKFSRNGLSLKKTSMSAISKASLDYFINKALKTGKSLFDSTLSSKQNNNIYNTINNSDFGINQNESKLLLKINGNDKEIRTTKIGFSGGNWSLDTNGAYRNRFIFNNPYPTSMEYFFQYISIYNWITDNSVNWEHLLFGSAFLTLNNDVEGVAYKFIDDNVVGYDNLRLLTKMVWRKWFIKGIVNSKNLDVSQFFELIAEIENETENDSFSYKDNQFNIKLIDSGFVIDESFANLNIVAPESLASDGLKEAWKAFNRKSKFYKKTNSKKLRDKEYRSGIELPVMTPTMEFFTDKDAPINSLNGVSQQLILSSNGSVDPDFQSFGPINISPIQLFFDNWEEHEFEEDNILILLGKGFMTFNLNDIYYDRDRYESAKGISDSSGLGFYVAEDDKSFVHNLSSEYGSDFSYSRDLEIKIKSNTSENKAVKQKKSIELIYTDFINKKPTDIHDCFNLDNVCLFLDDVGLFLNSNRNYSDLTILDNKTNLDPVLSKDNISLYPLFFNKANWDRWSLGRIGTNQEMELQAFNFKFFLNANLLNNEDYKDYKYSRLYMDLNGSITEHVLAKEPNTFFSSLTINFANDTVNKVLLTGQKDQFNKTSDFSLNCNKILIAIKILNRFLDTTSSEKNRTLLRRFIGPTQPSYLIEIESKKVPSVSQSQDINLIGNFYDIKVNTEVENCLLTN